MKDKIEKNFIIILDTNVLLNIYHYSPEFSDFALNCLKSVKDHIYLPATVLLEYYKHCDAMYLDMERRVSQAEKEAEDEIEAAKSKIIKSCDNLTRLHYPDIDVLVKELSKKLDDVRTTLDNYFDEHLSLSLIQHSWKETDCLRTFVDEIKIANHVMPSPSQEDIYRWCEEGEQRYKRKIPPGFMDAKDKDGVRKYSDLILWNETVRFAKMQGKNIVFVTDDVKADWWEIDNGIRHFHTSLLKEFCKTDQHIVPMISQSFYAEIADNFNIEKTDMVEIALRMTDEDYCFKIAEAVFEEIEDTLTYDTIEFIDVESAHIGSEGIEEFEVLEHEYIDAIRLDRDESTVTYGFFYKVSLQGTSYEYWGRDPDTNDIIRSDGRIHIFSGEIIVRVEREVEVFYDFEDDNSFETAAILEGDLHEEEYDDLFEPEPPGELGYCPDCGCPLNIENDGGNGFCINCAWEH